MTRSPLRRYTLTMRYLIAVLALLPTLALADITGPAKVIDGDTIEIAGQRIRLYGIDAPEGRQTCRREATFLLPFAPMTAVSYFFIMQWYQPTSYSAKPAGETHGPNASAQLVRRIIK